MAVFDLFSKRQRKLRGEVPDVFQYEDLPQPFRVQVLHILEDAFGGDGDHYVRSGADKAYQFLHDTLCREYGLLRLTERNEGHKGSVFNFFLTADTERAIDVIELAFRVVDGAVRSNRQEYYQRKLEPDSAIQELNQRFFESGIGYQYESGDVVRVDSRILHAEVVKPALSLLKEKLYAGANEEFLKAHEHYRHVRYKECLNECLKALESTMKVICTKRNWPFAPTDTAKSLLNTCLANDLVPAYLQSHFSGLRSTLESGVPTVRNKLGGHGQGTTPTDVSPSLASYILHLTATSILFLVEAEKELP